VIRYPRVWKVDGNKRVRKMIADTLRRWRKERRLAVLNAARACVSGQP
jgi:hypothetical protein